MGGCTPARRQSGHRRCAESPLPGLHLGFGALHPSRKPFTSLCEVEKLRCGQHGAVSTTKRWRRSARGFWSRGVSSSPDAGANGRCHVAMPRQGPAGTGARVGLKAHVLVQPLGKQRKERHLALYTSASWKYFLAPFLSNYSWYEKAARQL